MSTETVVLCGKTIHTATCPANTSVTLRGIGHVEHVSACPGQGTPITDVVILRQYLQLYEQQCHGGRRCQLEGLDEGLTATLLYACTPLSGINKVCFIL